MPTLIIDHADQTFGVVLDGRLLIGRAAPGGIVIPDSAVSRIHAWIDRNAHGFYVADADSRTGTHVGGQALDARHTLVDGDVIRVGPATIAYHETNELPGGVNRLPTAYQHDAAIAAAGGILFACTCGAPLWAPASWVGKGGKCAHCGQRTPVPALALPAHRLTPSPQPHAETQTCSICQWKIETDEEQTRCPTCGLTFHSECWQQNKGCSAYGCASVNALADPSERPAPPIVEPDPDPVEDIDETPEPFPVEFALLGGGLIASLIGLIAFGVPALLVAAYGIFFTMQKRKTGQPVRTGILAGAVAVCVLGCVAGLWLSAVKWLHHPLATPWLKA